MSKNLLLDVMEGDTFLRQVEFHGSGIPKLIDGEIVEVFDQKDLEKYVRDNYPSLNHHSFHVAISSQRVICRA